LSHGLLTVCPRTGIGAVHTDETRFAFAPLVLALALAAAKGGRTAKGGATVLALVARKAGAHAAFAHAIAHTVAGALVNDRRLLQARQFAYGPTRV
jgi:hypothetical protein